MKDSSWKSQQEGPGERVVAVTQHLISQVFRMETKSLLTSLVCLGPSLVFLCIVNSL